MNHPHIKIALAGNPNCGKTALFNALTGSSQREGNWPGVTVSRKEGNIRLSQKQTATVVDLPGIYSLSVLEEEGAVDEKISNDYLVNDSPDVIINVVDAANLERNLYLSTQLLETKTPVVIALNMMDIAKKQGTLIDIKKLQELTGCLVVPIVASKKKGIPELKRALQKAANLGRATSLPIAMNENIQPELSILKNHLSETQKECRQRDSLLIRLLEGDLFAKQWAGETLKKIADNCLSNIQKTTQEDADILIADARYQQIQQWMTPVITQKKTQRQTATDIIDRVVLNRFTGIPIFLAIIYTMFFFAINIGGAFQDFFDISSTAIFVDGTAQLLHALHFPNWAIALIANGIGKGVNTTITFIPVIGGMFLFLAFLEDCGYMARAAFIMDRSMRALGLPGKSFVPMIVGFGCNVPAVMGARTISSPRDRILTVMMMPFMSCGARLAIFAVFVSAFFSHGGGQNVVFALYILGIVVAVLTGLMLRKTVLPGESSSLIMELPQYHLPQFKTLMRHTWQRLRNFVLRAGKVIVPVCIIIGGLNSISTTGHHLNEQGGNNSLLSVAGKTITPIFEPMGIEKNNWPATVGLLTGVLAKEVVVGTLNTLYSQEGRLALDNDNNQSVLAGLKAALQSIPDNLSGIGNAFSNPIAASEPPHDMNHKVYGIMYQYFVTPYAAFAFLVFVLLYFPCVSTMAVMRRELSAGWANFSVAWSTFVAYGLAVICFQTSRLSAAPINASLWILAMLAVFAIFIMALRQKAKKPTEQKLHPTNKTPEVAS